MCVGHVVVLDVGLQVVVGVETGKVVLLALERAANRVLVGEERDYELTRSEDIQHPLDKIRIVILWCVRLETNIRAVILGGNVNREIMSL